MKRDAEVSDSPTHPFVSRFPASIVLCTGLEVMVKGERILQSSAHSILVFNNGIIVPILQMIIATGAVSYFGQTLL